MDIAVTIGALAALYTMMVASAYKLWDFVIRNSKKEIDDISSDYDKRVIRRALRKAQTRTLRGDDLNSLQRDLNLPLELKNAMGSERKTSITTYALLILSVIVVTFSLLYSNDALLAIGLYVTSTSIAALFIYVRDLYDIRNMIEKIKNRIREVEIVLPRQEETSTTVVERR
jgi:Flp pilus assembly protein TadB